MNEITHKLVPAPSDTLHAELRSLIASSRQRLAGAVNAELTRLYWAVGQRLRTEVLGEPCLSRWKTRHSPTLTASQLATANRSSAHSATPPSGPAVS